ncbi:MAG: CHAP domain-containing protein [Polyangia bacterium]
MQKLRGLLMVAASSMLLALAGACGVEEAQTAPEVQAAVADESLTVKRAVGPRDEEACSLCGNCVCYARSRQPRLPFGLITYTDKLRIINSSSAQVGCVAIMDTGSREGHVAYVESVGSRIKISEGNYPLNSCGSRTGTESSLRIKGYWCP